MHRFVANMDTGLRTVTTNPMWRLGTTIWPKPKQGHQFGPFLSRSASLFVEIGLSVLDYPSGPQLQPIQASALTITAVIVNPRLGTPHRQPPYQSKGENSSARWILGALGIASGKTLAPNGLLGAFGIEACLIHIEYNCWTFGLRAC